MGTSFLEAQLEKLLLKIKERRKYALSQITSLLLVVHPMIVWSFAYRQARKGTWEVDALDRLRFQKRIEEVDEILTPVLLAKIEEVKHSIK